MSILRRATELAKTGMSAADIRLAVRREGFSRQQVAAYLIGQHIEADLNGLAAGVNGGFRAR